MCISFSFDRPLQLPPRPETTLVYCSRGSSALVGLCLYDPYFAVYRRWYSLGVHKNVLLCHTVLALSSSVAGFGVSLSSVSFLVRVSSIVFVVSLFAVRLF